MNIKEIENPIKNFPGKDLNKDRSQDRVHLSDIYTSMEKEMNPRSVRESGNDLYWEVGFLFEEALGVVLGERLGVRLGEVELDGIVMSPDGVDWVNGRLEEYKCTWKSSKTTPEVVWKWMVQTKGYCKVLGFTEVLFRILYLMGDYKGSGPQYKEFLVTFTQEDIDGNWEMVKAHAKRKGWL